MLQGQEIDVALFDRNRASVPADRLRPYFGKHVAWDAEATRILAAGDTVEEVLAALDAQGIDPLSTVLDFIHDPSRSYLG